METCIQCGNGVQNRIMIQNAGGLLGVTGPFCSLGCKNKFRDYEDSKKQAKKEQNAFKKQINNERAEQLEYLKLEKELIDKEDEKEKSRLKRVRVAALEEQNRPIQAKLLKYSDALIGVSFLYLFATFIISIFLKPSNDAGPASWVWIVSGIIYFGIAGYVLLKFSKEFFRKVNVEQKIKVEA